MQRPNVFTRELREEKGKRGKGTVGLFNRILLQKLFPFERVQASTARKTLQLAEQLQLLQTHCMIHGRQGFLPSLIHLFSVVTKGFSLSTAFRWELRRAPSLPETITLGKPFILRYFCVPGGKP